MDDKTKEGYLVSGGFVLAGLIFLYFGWGNFDLAFFVGVGLAVLGAAGFKWPGMAEVLLHWAKKQGEANSYNSRQTQKNTKNSTQATAKRDVNMYYYNKSNLPEERASDEKKELIKEINQDLTKEKLSNVLMKCIRLAILTDSEKEKIWLENEAQGLDIGGGEHKKGVIPSYRVINAKIRIADNSKMGYQTLNYPLGLIHPIFQIEDWIEEYGEKLGKAEMILTAPASTTFKKVHRNVFGKDPPQKEIPSIIPLSELRKVLNGLKFKISKFVNDVR